ncbi:uncharacterized protein LOC121771017 isoform X1 [Salvia splendens]|uniref:uncharacterized protein LOC121771017 isoform X1 n=2 Tax=Salvia splendens TaxID=180675 RepID=UPI001C26D50E|nr:uncharacterized protein LOC121771017 isoform X1 [Salvia splendens]
MQMKLLVNDDPTTLSYWLNWRVFLCAVWVLAPMVIAAFIIWKYEHSGNSESDAGENQQESSHIRSEKSWKPCLKEIHPVFLLCFRIIAFGLLLTAVSFDLALHGAELFYYYTQWTFTLVTIYFGLGSLLSIRGCFYSPKIDSNSKCYLTEDTEQALHVPLAHGVNGNGMRLPEKLDNHGTLHTLITSDVWDDLYQVLFQVTAGAVTLTDIVYWGVIFPFMALKDYEMGFLTVVTHSLNAVLLLGDTAICSLEFPWFRISYFILLTGIYVIFQWIVHACVSIWWPYPFLDLSADLAPMWYLVVALMHVPCYAIFLVFVKVKHWLLSRWFPHSYQYSS